MNDTPLKVERDGAVATLTLNAPERRNGIVPELIEAMLSAVAEIDADASISCAILTGADPAFCAGGNLKGMYTREGVYGSGFDERKAFYVNGIQRLTLAMTSIKVSDPHRVRTRQFRREFYQAGDDFWRRWRMVAPKGDWRCGGGRIDADRRYYRRRGGPHAGHRIEGRAA